MALLARVVTPELVLEPVAVARIRRCTFRRLGRVASGPVVRLEVNCLYPDRRIPLPLGDLESSQPICDACAAVGIFRPDED